MKLKKKLLALSRDDQMHQSGVTTVSISHLYQTSIATQYRITLTNLEYYMHTFDQHIIHEKAFSLTKKCR